MEPGHIITDQNNKMVQADTGKQEESWQEIEKEKLWKNKKIGDFMAINLYTEERMLEEKL